MNVTPTSDRLLLSLAYGNGYKIVGEGENAEIQMLNGAKPRTIYDLQTDSDTIFKGLYIADALNVTKESHPVLIALAYGEEGVNFDYDGDEIKMRDGHFPKSLQDLSGSKSENLINDLTLEAALGVNKDSDSLMKGLAFGQQGVHYTVNETSGKIEMKQIWYTFDGATLKDANGYEINYTQNGETLQIEVDGTAQYLKAEGADSNVYLAYDSENNPLYYKKATLGTLSGNPDSLLNNITVADAMGIESYENEQDALKKAIAFDSQGNPYTIGQLSNDPNMIIFSIHLDTVIEADSKDPLIMYLLYGKDGIHYTIQDAEVEGRSREIEVEEDGVIKTKYVVMSQQMVAVHDGNHLHNEYGEALYEQPNVLYHVTPLTDSDYDYKYVRDGATYFLKEYVKNDEPQQIRIVDNHANENIHLYAPAYLVFAQDENGAINPVYYEHNSLDSMAGEDASLISNLTTRLTLEELLVGVDMETNFILKHLSHTVISELPHSIETLTIAQVFEDDVYETDTNGNRVLKGTWKYLLEDTTPNKDDNGNFIIKNGEYVYTAADEYTLLQMSELMENMTGNVTKASLFELKEDKLITSLDKDTLDNPINDLLKNKAIPVKNADGTTTYKTIEELGYNYLGDFTVEHLLAFVAVLMTNPLA